MKLSLMMPANHIEVMLLDWSMPDVVGIELLRQDEGRTRVNEAHPGDHANSDGSLRKSYPQGYRSRWHFSTLVKPVKKDPALSTHFAAALLDYEIASRSSFA
jgi:hypothetical protein